MRWERLFDDLEAALEAQQRRELDSEVADRVRRERSLVGLADRLAAARGGPELTLEVDGLGIVTGVVRDLGGEGGQPGGDRGARTGAAGAGRAADGPASGGPTPGGGWLLLEDRPGAELLIPLDALGWVSGLPRRFEPVPLLTRRFGFGLALRGLARDRAPVVVTGRSGRSLQGTIDAVGRDLIELAEHAVDTARRRDEVVASRVVPFAAIAAVRRAR